MTEGEVYALVIKTLDDGLKRFASAIGFDVDVRQAYQPRVMGAPLGAALLLSSVGPSRRYGFLGLKDELVEATADKPAYFRHIESQQMQVRMQCAALRPLADPPPAPAPPITATDLAQYAAAILQSSAGLAQLRVAGVGIERITDVRTPNFTDDMDQFEQSPSFDFTLDFNWSLVSEVPIVDTTELRVARV